MMRHDARTMKVGHDAHSTGVEDPRMRIMTLLVKIMDEIMVLKAMGPRAQMGPKLLWLIGRSGERVEGLPNNVGSYKAGAPYAGSVGVGARGGNMFAGRRGGRGLGVGG